MGLTLNSLNEVLVNALKDGTSEKDLLEAELGIIADLVMTKTGELLDELDKNGYESELFTQIKNIKNNSEALINRLKELEEAQNGN